MKKRILAVFLAALMSLTALIVVPVGADTVMYTGTNVGGETFEYGFEYTVDENGATITKYIREWKTYGSVWAYITIPSTLGGAPVTTIGEKAFSGLYHDAFIIPSTVTTIGRYGLAASSTDHKSVIFPADSALTTIGDYAFYGCYVSFNNNEIPDSVTSIGDGAFYYAHAGYYLSPYNLVLPHNLTTIKRETFKYSGIKAVTIPVSVTTIESYAFAGEYSHPCYINKVYYAGTPEQWNNISVYYGDNSYLRSAMKYYNHPAHSFTYHEAVEPTCTQTGNLEYYQCDLCQQYFLYGTGEENITAWSNISIPATGEHTYVRGVCSVCGAVDESFILYGDADGNGEITSKDVTLIRRYIASYDDSTGSSSVEVAPGADVNANGEITSKDVTLLRRYLASYDESTGTASVVLGPQN